MLALLLSGRPPPRPLFGVDLRSLRVLVQSPSARVHFQLCVGIEHSLLKREVDWSDRNQLLNPLGQGSRYEAGALKRTIKLLPLLFVALLLFVLV
jgi:hypothetical protein